MSTVSRVLVLGASGAVGGATAQALAAHGVDVVLAGRDVPRLRAIHPSASAYYEVDLTRVAQDPAHSRAFGEALDTVDVVVSCAGPSYRLTQIVAERAVTAGVNVVDAGGESLGPMFDEAAGAADVTVALGAGVQPGLTGLVLYQAVRGLGERAASTQVHGWCGGLQRLTVSAVDEYLHAAQQGSDTGTALRRGLRVKVRPGASALPAMFPSTAREHLHLDPECADIARLMGVDDLRWANVTDGVVSERVLARCLSGDITASEGVRAAAVDLFGQEPYFHIVVEADSGPTRSWAQVSCRDSYRVSGWVAAGFALHTLELRPGAFRASELMLHDGTWQQLREWLGDAAEFRHGVGSLDGAGAVAEPQPIEEGEL